MHFLLSSMSVVYVLTTPISEDDENATIEQIRKRNKWDNDDYVCRGLILNEVSYRIVIVAGPSVVNMMEYKNSLRIAKVEKLATRQMVQAQMDDDIAWWVDPGETVHVCKDRCWFNTYESQIMDLFFKFKMSQQPGA
ncbi:hypothetical protein Tco_1028947 [Tanacetum coccineum]|uniref:Uncharacterized protein n=1 Tax=Tanacetum coccineum TaxID=301880 RepID=A0ABQ5G211_9ASTR